jgi:2',3'-cyclic-nucleotide 2'-phosphodiesterase (5'-nucleotidase family)
MSSAAFTVAVSLHVGSPAVGQVLPDFTLQLLHAADQEGAAAAVKDAPNFSAVLNALRSESGVADATLTLSSGDAFIPGLFFGASKAVYGSAGIADIQIQNELGFQAIAFGNHEFDFGTEALAGLIDGSAPGSILGADFAGTDFPYLSANLDFSTDANLAGRVVADGLTPQAGRVTGSTVITQDGETFGIVGATTPTLASISSPGDVGIAPSPFGANPTDEELDALAAEIQAEVDALLAANASMNKVILLAHMQRLEIELALAERLENVDIIVAGGSNTRLFDDDDRPRDDDSEQGEYPQFVTNAGGTTTAVVNTDGSYKYVGRLVIDFDADGNLIPGSYDSLVSGAYATDDQGVSELGAEGLIDPEIQQIAAEIEAQIIATESNVFGLADVFLNGNRSGTGELADPDGVRTQETNLGNLTADANLVEAQLFDPTVVVSIKNGGGIRAPIGQTVVPPGGSEPERLPNEEVLDSDGNLVKPAGGISENDIKTTLAFNNGLTLLTLSKEELVAVLEHGVAALPGVAGQFPQVSGVKLSFDPDLPAGERIVSAGIFDAAGSLLAELVREGELVGDPDETFRIVTLDFLAAPRFDDDGKFIGGGDGYPFPNTNEDDSVGEVGDSALIARVNRVALTDEYGGTATGTAIFAEDGSEQDALAEYLAVSFPDSDQAFQAQDVGPGRDGRIQNLVKRSDTVLLPPAPPADAIQLSVLGTFETGLFDEGAQEIAAHDPETQRLFVTNAADASLDILDIADPAQPTLLDRLDLQALLGSQHIAVGPNSVAVRDGIVAVAVARETAEGGFPLPGLVAFLSTDGQLLDTVEVGYLPDMLTYTPNGKWLIVANEGEPTDDYSFDPEGSVSVIRLRGCRQHWRRACELNVRQRDVRTADFRFFNRVQHWLEHRGVRIYGPGATVAQDLEPEYIAVSEDSRTAYVTLQENNAIALVSIPFAKVLRIEPLGLKDWEHSGSGLDASNRDDSINIAPWPVMGMYQPDAIAAFEIGRSTYLITANEGDARDYDGFSEEERVADLDLDQTAFPDADALQEDAALGRLNATTATGDLDGDGDFDQIHGYGGRSFSIWRAWGNRLLGPVYDSGSLLEELTAALLPTEFNSNNDENDSFDSRSDDKGPEPEGVTVGKVRGRIYAFVGLERVSGVMVFDVSNPYSPAFVQYVSNRDFSGDAEKGTAGDLGPEGLLFIPAKESPINGVPLLAVTNEVSGTTTLYRVD